MERGEDADLVAIAYVRKPVGLKGWCGVTPQGDVLGALELPTKVFVGRTPKRQALEEIVLRDVRRDPKGFACLFDGSSDRDGAERLRERVVYVERSRLPDLSEDEYYQFELEGMTVVAAGAQEALGTVKEVHNYPSVDALEVVLKDGRTILVPLNKETIVSIDRGNSVVTADESMLEELL